MVRVGCSVHWNAPNVTPDSKQTHQEEPENRYFYWTHAQRRTLSHSASRSEPHFDVGHIRRGPRSEIKQAHRRHRCHFIWTFLQLSNSWPNSTHTSTHTHTHTSTHPHPTWLQSVQLLLFNPPWNDQINKRNQQKLHLYVHNCIQLQFKHSGVNIFISNPE